MGLYGQLKSSASGGGDCVYVHDCPSFGEAPPLLLGVVTAVFGDVQSIEYVLEKEDLCDAGELQNDILG